MDPTQFPPTLEPPPRVPLVPLILTVLAPPLTILAGLFYLMAGGGGDGVIFLNLFGSVSIVCWIGFGHLLRPCYRGVSFWLMFSAYPCAQLSIILAIGAAAGLVSIPM
jgi:hypothetical protein